MLRRRNFIRGRLVSTQKEYISIGGIKVIKGHSSSKLVPEQPFKCFPPEIVYHLRWMAQKYNIGQDMFICGYPGPLRRHLVMAFASLCRLEVEYVNCTRDLTESDLKQRREIEGRNIVFRDQPPIRAALNGRLLVIDGIEHAERNVLPTLNNLLENREISLDDGRFMTNERTAKYLHQSDSLKSGNTDKIISAHPNFRVVALGRSVPPYQGQPLDPPLRSRLQSHFVDDLLPETLTDIFAEDMRRVEDTSKVEEVLQFYESVRAIRQAAFAPSASTDSSASRSRLSSVLPVFSMDSFAHCIALLSRFPALSAREAVERCVPAISWMKPSSLPSLVEDALQRAVTMLGNKSEYQYQGETTLQEGLLPGQHSALKSLLEDLSLGKHVCLFGPRVSTCSSFTIVPQLKHASPLSARTGLRKDLPRAGIVFSCRDPDAVLPAV